MEKLKEKKVSIWNVRSRLYICIRAWFPTNVSEVLFRLFQGFREDFETHSSHITYSWVDSINTNLYIKIAMASPSGPMRSSFSPWNSFKAPHKMNWAGISSLPESAKTKSGDLVVEKMYSETTFGDELPRWHRKVGCVLITEQKVSTLAISTSITPQLEWDSSHNHESESLSVCWVTGEAWRNAFQTFFSSFITVFRFLCDCEDSTGGESSTSNGCIHKIDNTRIMLFVS